MFDWHLHFNMHLHTNTLVHANLHTIAHPWTPPTNHLRQRALQVLHQRGRHQDLRPLLPCQQDVAHLVPVDARAQAGAWGGESKAPSLVKLPGNGRACAAHGVLVKLAACRIASQCKPTASQERCAPRKSL